MKSLAQALFDTGFVTCSWYPMTGGADGQLPQPLSHDFHPEATAPRNRYGPVLRDVKGYPDGIPHGGLFSTRNVVGDRAVDPDLAALMGSEPFLAANPQFRGVVLNYDVDYLDLSFLAGAWSWLVMQNARFNPSPAGATGPHREPGGGVAPPPPQTAPPAPVPQGPSPTPAPPPPPAPLAPAASATGGFTPEERAALVQLVEGRFPGEGEKVAGVVDLALAKDRKPLDIAKAVLPLVGVTDPRIIAALDLAALFGG